MKSLKLCLPILLSVALLGCNNEAVATHTQTISVQKVTPANVAKPKTTTLKQNDDSEVQLVESVTEPVEEVTEVVTPKKSASSSNAALKDVIIDGHGNLVVAKADGSFMSYAPIKGDKGDKGDRGDQGAQGVQGERGADGKDGINGVDGKDGKDGRGIDHCELTDTKDLVIYYTDGTSQNVGNLTVTAPSDDVTPPVDNTPEYEKVGYKVPSDVSLSIQGSHSNNYGAYCDYSCDISIVLDSIKNNPIEKYVYRIICNYSISNSISAINEPNNYVWFDIGIKNIDNDIRYTNISFANSPITNASFEQTLSCPIPLIRINSFSKSN